MGITISPITPDFAAEIGDVDLAQPLAAADFAEIQQAFWKYAVLMVSEICPAITSVTRGPVPLYGMAVMSVLLNSLKYSFARCDALPLPDEA